MVSLHVNFALRCGSGMDYLYIHIFQSMLERRNGLIPQIPVYIRGFSCTACCIIGAEIHSNNREMAIVWLRPRRDKPPRNYCCVNLGQTLAVCTIAFVYLPTLQQLRLTT